MVPVFNDGALQKQFERKGYLLFTQFLNGTELSELQSLFEKHKAQFEGPFHASHFSRDIAYKQEVHDIISKVVFSRAQKILNNYVPLFGNFMVKNPYPDMEMDLHADWTYVDESIYTSVAVWIPLIDVNTENGCLGIIEGSHRVTNLIRGPLIRQCSPELEKSWEKSFGKLLPFKAGDAIFYNHRLLHYSHPNKSAAARPAINLSLAPAEAKWIHYCRPEGSKDIQLHKVPDSFFYINYTYLKSPQVNTLVKTLPGATVKYIDSAMKKFRFTKWGNAIKEWLN